MLSINILFVPSANCFGVAVVIFWCILLVVLYVLFVVFAVLLLLFITDELKGGKGACAGACASSFKASIFIGSILIGSSFGASILSGAICSILYFFGSCSLDCPLSFSFISICSISLDFVLCLVVSFSSDENRFKGFIFN